ncbi:MAG: shikimate dehydrogenase [Alcaligenaceae bacterium]|jgi:shikimate dehydrogenase|nr:shikimate dehydrogenase [Alcaligenaceae bacterium]
MNVIFEEGGQFRVARVLSETEANYQIELSTGKRSKVKRNNVIFEFAKEPCPIADILPKAQELADEIDAAFLWEFASQEDFKVEDLALDYYGHEPEIIEKLALLLQLHASPIYFHRRGKGQYRAAPPEILEAALAAVEKKRLQEEQQTKWTESLVNFELPEEMAADAKTFLTEPNKNTLQWKAFENALSRSGLNIKEMLLKLGVYKNELAITLAGFLEKHFPKGYETPELPLPKLPELPLAEIEAYSIDNDFTTEIDDAFSVKHLEDETYQFGVHIAAPALVVTKDSELDLAARKRMSTIYLPGQKITMQGENLIEAFSLNAGEVKPCISLYIVANLESGEIISNESKVESIKVKENLRLSMFDDELLTATNLADESVAIPYDFLIRPLWRLTRHLSAKRDEVRGYPETNKGHEFSFILHGDWQDQDAEIELVQRRRDLPIDMLIGEMMIYTNVLWAGTLSHLKVPGIFRTQQFGRAKQSSHAIPHQTMGVPQYAWMTSPLRRYVDLLNQQQLISAIQHGVSAPLVAPYKNKDVDLLVVMTSFDALNQQWRNFQDTVERFWALRWLQQQGIEEAEATVIRDSLVRLNIAPLTLLVDGLPEYERGTVIKIKIEAINLLKLNTESQFLEFIAEPTVNGNKDEDDEASNETVRCAVFGYPIAQSVSPTLHSIAAKQTGLNLQYDKVEVKPDDFRNTVKQFFDNGGRGLNITIPFKLEAFELAKENLTERAKSAQAVNTLWFENDAIHGDNTDGIGLVNDIKNHGHDIVHKRILLIGAGGAARGALLPLLDAGCSALHIANRTVSKADDLAEQARKLCTDSTKITSSGLEDIPGQWDIVINSSASSLEQVTLPIPENLFSADALAYDMVYKANGSTPFLEQSQAFGASHLLDGLGMLVGQGLESFKIWHGLEADATKVLAELRLAMQAEQ